MKVIVYPVKRASQQRKIAPRILNGFAVFILLDLEHGVYECGITQLSAQLFRLGSMGITDMAKDVIVKEVFNKYVRPPLTAKWNEFCTSTSGLTATHPSITRADGIEVLWKRFTSYLDKPLELMKELCSSLGMVHHATSSGYID